MTTLRYDVAIIGAGMAGASLAAELAPHASVVLLETEAQPGYHATGRSAAFWTESYGGRQIQPLTTASGAFLREHRLLGARGALTIARSGQQLALEKFAIGLRVSGVWVVDLDRQGLLTRIPGLREDWTAGALEPDCSDIDVAGLHALYLKTARDHHSQVLCNAELKRAERTSSGWMLSLANGRELKCDMLVNAAGAWADPVAQLAGVRPVGLVPLRRTVAQLRTAPAPPTDLPLVLDLGGAFYFKPEAGRLWLSPHDETQSAPCDAAPEELDVALAIDRLGDVVDWQIERVEHRWAGLRTFAPDRLPVYGFDAACPGFFWFAGQGGFGIQTAPAAAQLAAGLLLGKPTGAVDPAPYLASRFG